MSNRQIPELAHVRTFNREKIARQNIVLHSITLLKLYVKPLVATKTKVAICWKPFVMTRYKVATP